MKLTCIKTECLCAAKLPNMDELPCSQASWRMVTCGNGEPCVPDPQLGFATAKVVLLVRNGDGKYHL